MNQTLVDHIYSHIHSDIINNSLLPGQRLHIGQLAEQYRVGPGPVREALSRLSTTELVKVICQKGFRVAPISKANLLDVYRTRAQVEAASIKLSIKHGNDRWEANLISSYHILAKYEEENKIHTLVDYKEWERRQRNFNFALISACGLENLLHIQENLYHLTERYRRRWLIAGIEKAKKLIYAKKLLKLMNAALARDTKLAEELILNYYENAITIIQSYYEQNKLFEVPLSRSGEVVAISIPAEIASSPPPTLGAPRNDGGPEQMRAFVPGVIVPG